MAPGAIVAGGAAARVNLITQVFKMMKFGVVDNGLLIIMMMAGVNCELTSPPVPHSCLASYRAHRRRC